jgi:uncharacterized membrane protein
MLASEAPETTIGAAGASLIVVGFTLSQASHNHAPARGPLTALALMSVALAWSSLHTAYPLRYARLYLLAARRRHRLPRRSP